MLEARNWSYCTPNRATSSANLMANNQLKCGTLYEKNAMPAGDDEQIINWEWPYQATILERLIY